jgi:hypothetical protein
MTDEDLESLREQTSQGDRLDEAATKGNAQEFVDDIVAELQAIDDGEQQKTVSVWDGPMAAFVRALEENPEQLEAIGQSLAERRDVTVGEIDRSEVLRHALRLGIETAAPDQYEAVEDAVRQQATDRL